MPFPGVTITFRTAGVWGAGVGRNLTAAEFDNNNQSLKLAVEYLNDNPPTPDNIASITVLNNNMTITTELGTVYGPFLLPIAEFRDRGAWADATDYLYGDIFTQGTGLYMVQREHTSEAPFDPDATGIGGPLYRLLFDASALTMTFLEDGYPAEGEPLKAFDVFAVDDVGVFMVLLDHDAAATFDPDAVDDDLNPLYKKIFAAIETAIGRIQFQYAGTFPANSSLVWKYINDDPRNLVFAADFAGSLAHIEVATTTETLEWVFMFGGDEVGRLTFAPGDNLDGDGGQFGTFTGDGVPDGIPNNGLFRVLAPDVADATASFLTLALVGSYVAP